MTQATTFPVMAPTGPARSNWVGRILLTGIITAVLYSALSSGSSGICPGGYDENGFVDANGAPTTVRPLCLTVTFHPQSWVLLLIAAIVITTAVTIGRVTDARARRITTIAAIAIVAVGVAATLATLPAFYTDSVMTWRGGEIPRFWFDAGTVVSPMINS